MLTRYLWQPYFYISPLKGLGSFIFMNEMNTFIQQGYIKLIKCGNTYIYNVLKSISENAVVLYFLFIAWKIMRHWRLE